MHVHKSGDRTHNVMTAVMFLLFLITGILAALSLLHQKLYSPFGILTTADSGANFYYGISIYITIAATLLTSALIRIALRITK
ncbi:hypothetical protein [Pelagicoccus mobilis]|uniref:Uncharacterized protein n=1 Tax=Pelagicoccus mobilis TaxID=415221 RepID=A0A934RWQ8_9BACT|nr:hypothetical protein [Pelagicoccus mobilis]MBK1876181.1 hypothetical protein [Pelagicoccus mobilis]